MANHPNRMPKWKKKIGKKLTKHVMDYCGGTLHGFRKGRLEQAKVGVTCFECNAIAARLGEA